MKVLVGVDGGGTKARAIAYVISDGAWDSHCPIGQGDAGPCNIALMSTDAAAGAIETAVAAAGAEADAVVGLYAAVAGYSFATRRRPFLDRIQRLFPKAALSLAPDYLAAFRGGFPAGRGVIVVAGTGSVAYASDGAGRSHRAGGYGYVIDDSGSGYGVGRGALSAVLRAMDGTGETTALSERIADAAGASDWDGTLEAVYGGRLDRVAIAALARIVSETAAQGDAASRKLMMHAGGALARLAEAVYAPVFGGKTSDPINIALTGSLWQSNGLLMEVFTQSVRRFAPNANVGRCDVDPAAGAAYLAADKLSLVASAQP